MKLLAVLKDSLRETIDTKVFYVMVGLSLFVTLIAATVTFRPKPVGKEVMMFAGFPLNMDDAAEKLTPEMLGHIWVQAANRGYMVVRAEPADGAEDGPGSTFRVLVRKVAPTAEDAKRIKKSPGATEEFIAKRFGVMGELRVVDVIGVRLVDRPADLREDEVVGPMGPAEAEPPKPAGEVKEKHADGEKAEQAKKPAPMLSNEVFFEVTTRPTSATRRLWPHTFSLFFGALPFGEGGVPLGFQLFIIENYIVGGIGAWVTVLIGIVITAFFIPNMLRKGTVDMLVVKPIHRSTLLLYKFLGGLLFILLTTAVAILGIWIALGLRSGVWATGILLMIPVLTFSFAILYSVSALFGVLTRSAVVCILMTCAVWFVLFITTSLSAYFEARRQQEEKANVPVAERVSENWFAKSVRVVHFVLPRRGDMDRLTGELLLRDLLTANQVKEQKIDRTPVSWGESLTVSGLFVAVMLGLACLRFSTKDY